MKLLYAIIIFLTPALVHAQFDSFEPGGSGTSMYSTAYGSDYLAPADDAADSLYLRYVYEKFYSLWQTDYWTNIPSQMVLIGPADGARAKALYYKHSYGGGLHVLPVASPNQGTGFGVYGRNTPVNIPRATITLGAIVGSTVYQGVTLSNAYEASGGALSSLYFDMGEGIDDGEIVFNSRGWIRAATPYSATWEDMRPISAIDARGGAVRADTIIAPLRVVDTTNVVVDDTASYQMTDFQIDPFVNGISNYSGRFGQVTFDIWVGNQSVNDEFDFRVISDTTNGVHPTVIQVVSLISGTYTTTYGRQYGGKGTWAIIQAPGGPSISGPLTGENATYVTGPSLGPNTGWSISNVEIVARSPNSPTRKFTVTVDFFVDNGNASTWYVKLDNL